MLIKRIYHNFTYTTSLMLCCMLLLAACVNEDEVLSPDERKQEIVDLSMNMANRSGTVGSDSETKKVRIIAFDSMTGELVYNQKIDNPVDDPVKIQILSGVRDFYVITNEPDNQTTTLNAIKLLKDLQAVRIPWDAVEQGTTFVTFGTLLAQTIKIGESNTIYMHNYRLAVKIDLTLNGKNFTPAQEVSFSNLPDAIPLFDVPYDCAQDNRQTKTIKSLTNDGTVSSGYVWTRKATIVLPSYIFDPVTDIDKAVRISVPIGSGEVGEDIGHDVAKKDYTLHRNTIYSLTANVGSDKLIINAQVRNWDENEADYPAGGGSFWKEQPQDTRVGLNGTTEEATAVFSAGLTGSGTSTTFKWYRKKQLADFSFETTEITGGISSENNKSQLTMVATSLEDACEVYCVATTKAPDGNLDRLESERATFMVVGDWVQPAGTYPFMENWKAPMNAPLGSTCLLQDDRDNKVYRVKLMADGNWWMIQDLAYGNASDQSTYDNYSSNKGVTNQIKSGLYGVCKIIESATATATGGYMYNSYAAIQLPQGTGGDHNNGVALNTEFIQGLCPDGWHLPGNMDGKYNKEWENLQNVLKWDVTNPDDVMKMGYNDAFHFNGYSLYETVDATFKPIKAISFWGGYTSILKSKVPTFISLGFSTNDLDNGTVTDPGMGLVEEDGLSIRCLKNFK